MINQVVLQGRITKDPELRRTKNGKSYLNFDLAVNDYNNQPDYFRVTAWENRAAAIAGNVRKGDMIVIAGTLKTESWTTNSGEKRSMVKINLNDFGFCGSPKRKRPDYESQDFAIMMDEPVF